MRFTFLARYVGAHGLELFHELVYWVGVRLFGNCLFSFSPLGIILRWHVGLKLDMCGSFQDFHAEWRDAEVVCVFVGYFEYAELYHLRDVVVPFGLRERSAPAPNVRIVS